MLYNKNKVSKTNDKKILHKVGKQWKVVSVALLMAVAGGAVATHAANADSTNDANNTNVNSLVQTLNTPASANAPVFAQSSASANTKSVASVSASSVQYYSGDNGSAASYFDKVDQDNATANKYYKAVNSYVNSLGAVYGPQISSFSAKQTSASSAASNDTKLANSYSATVNDPKTMSTISSLASKNSTDPELYVDMVTNNEETYSGAVSSASADVKAASDVKSLVSKFEGVDWSAASLSASTADVVASSNLAGAQGVAKSVASKFNTTNGAAAYVNVANKLSAGVKTLLAEGNPVGLNAQYSMLLNDNQFSSAAQSDAQKAYSSAVSYEVSAAKSAFNSIVGEQSNSNFTAQDALNDLSAYADGDTLADAHYAFDSLVASTDAEITSPLASATSVANSANATSEFTAAVSAATAQQFAATLQSAANSLYGKWNPKYANAKALSAEASAATASASAKVKAASYADLVADNNSALVDYLYGLVGTSASADSVAAVAYGMVSSGVSGFEYSMGLAQPTYPEATSSVSDQTTYLDSLVGDNGDAEALLTDLATDYNTNHVNGASLAGKTQTQAQHYLGSLATDLNTVNFNSNDFKNSNHLADSNAALHSAAADATATDTDAYNLLVTQNGANYAPTGLLNDALTQVGGTAINTTADQFNQAVGKIKSALNAAANASQLVYQSNDGLSYNAGNASASDTDNYDVAKAALLSDGVDVDALEAESGAISNVATQVNSELNSESTSTGAKSASAEWLNDGMSVAASSANSAENSADNASASYSTANDEDVTLASYFTSSYTSLASSESDTASAESSSLDSFFKSAASDSTFNSEDDAYNDAVKAATNDYKLGVSNSKAVYNNLPHFLDVLKSAKLHSTPNYGAKDDKVLGVANKGDRLIVKGVNVSRNNTWRGVVRFAVKDATNGKSGFFTGQQAFWKGAYLPSTAQTQNVSVQTLKPVQVYSEINGKKSVGTVPAGKVLNNVTVVYDNDAKDGQGFTKVETANLQFVTANTDYVKLYTAPVKQTNTNNTPSYNFNLQNPDQKMGAYFNNDSQE